MAQRSGRAARRRGEPAADPDPDRPPGGAARAVPGVGPGPRPVRRLPRRRPSSSPCERPSCAARTSNGESTASTPTPAGVTDRGDRGDRASVPRTDLGRGRPGRCCGPPTTCTDAPRIERRPPGRRCRPTPAGRDRRARARRRAVPHALDARQRRRRRPAPSATGQAYGAAATGVRHRRRAARPPRRGGPRHRRRTRSIGRGCAVALARAGCHVVVADLADGQRRRRGDRGAGAPGLLPSHGDMRSKPVHRGARRRHGRAVRASRRRRQHRRGHQGAEALPRHRARRVGRGRRAEPVHHHAVHPGGGAGHGPARDPGADHQRRVVERSGRGAQRGRVRRGQCRRRPPHPLRRARSSAATASA